MTGNLSFMKSNVTTLGEWIRAGLKDAGKNQVWLAEKIGVQPPQVSRIISGVSEPTPDLLSSISDALGKPREQIYRAAGLLPPVAKVDEEMESILHEITKLPKDDQREVLAFIRIKNNLRKK